jgi:anti-sigma B factor antagonist
MARAARARGSISSDVVAGGTEILTLDGDFDMSNCAEFERRLSEACEPEPTDILVDLRGVSFLGSTMLHALVRGLTQANERGTGFALIRPYAFVWRVFVLTGLSARFLNYASLDEALPDMEQGGHYALLRDSDGAVLAEFDSEEAVLEVIERIWEGELPARGVSVVRREDAFALPTGTQMDYRCCD